MLEQNNGQGLHPKPKRHTGKFIDGRKRQAIITALANGESLRSIGRRLSTSKNTIAVIARENWTQVDARKKRIAAQAELNATLAAERITDELESQKHIPLNVLVPVFGVNADKLSALRGDSSLTINHQHTLEIKQSHQALADALMSFHRPKLIDAKVIQTLSDKTRQPASTRGQNAVQKGQLTNS